MIFDNTRTRTISMLQLVLLLFAVVALFEGVDSSGTAPNSSSSSSSNATLATQQNVSAANERHSSVVFRTNLGKLRGFSVAEMHDPRPDAVDSPPRSVNVFLGIPFAQPPVGELRFEKPVPVKRWPNDEVRNATRFASSCVPSTQPEVEFIKISTNGVPVSEDCLYLNIIAPAWSSDEDLFPVAVLIHGGGFHIGSSAEFGWRHLAERYVLRGIVVVTIQYRLGVLGFGSTGDEAMPGNLGLWDQTEALRFVQQHIPSFGGDPDRVTIWGHSGGGASVSALTYSPFSRDLFAAVIDMSGTMFAEWASSNRAVLATEKVAEAVGCSASSPTSDVSEDTNGTRPPLLHSSEQIKRCFRTKTIDELLQAVQSTKDTRSWDTNIVRFSPRIDDEFFPAHLKAALLPDDEGDNCTKQPPPTGPDPPSKKSTLIGASDAEYLLFGLPDEYEPKFFHNPGSTVDAKDYAEFSGRNVAEFVDRAVASERVFGRVNAKLFREKILDFYLHKDRGWFAPKDYKFYLSRWVELFSDIMIMVPTLIEARVKAAAGWPVYVYLVTFARHIPAHVPINGSYHAIEYPALFDQHFRPLSRNWSAEDRAFQTTIVDAFVQFIKTGDPSTPTLPWPKANVALEPYMQLDVSSKLIAKPMEREKLEFWQRLRDDFDFDVIRGIQKTTLRYKDEL